MADKTKVIASFPGGSALVTTPRQDQYWLRDSQGVHTRCPLEQAVKLWVEAKKLWLIPSVHAFALAEAPPEVMARQTMKLVPTTPEDIEAGYTEWQLELLKRLGLTPEDIDPLTTPTTGKGGN